MSDQPEQVPLVDLSNVIEVNPNALYDVDPEIYVALVDDARYVPAENQLVTVVQPEDDQDEVRFVSTAQVLEVDAGSGLIRLRVDWDGFHEEIAARVTANVNRVSNFIVVYNTDVFVASPRRTSSGPGPSETTSTPPDRFLAAVS